jgi:hypothetical protein
MTNSTQVLKHENKRQTDEACLHSLFMKCCKVAFDAVLGKVANFSVLNHN